jgi:hypothetical protein
MENYPVILLTFVNAHTTYKKMVPSFQISKGLISKTSP